MITEALISSFFALLDALTSLFPSSWSPPGFLTSGTVAVWAQQASAVFPVAPFVSVGLAMLALIVGLRVWDFAVWVFHQFWGSD